jgi:N-acetylglucosaminyldiphosphoundecaprenol N-acetyl-beta-D-mannosaminyltransferase
LKEKTTIDILGVPVTPFSMKEAVEWLMNRVDHHIPTHVITANAEIIMMCQDDPSYLELLRNSDLVLPDGAGTVWAGRKLGYNVPERVAGFDLFVEILKYAAQHGQKIYFFGAAPGIAEAAAKKAGEIAPGVQIVGMRNGYFKEEESPSIVDAINASGADILFAALGAPKQEYWLKQYGPALKPSLRIGLGGSFDVLAGKMERAPEWMQKASLEWLFRLYKQPSRLGRMMALPKFVLKVLNAKSSAHK